MQLKVFDPSLQMRTGLGRLALKAKSWQIVRFMKVKEQYASIHTCNNVIRSIQRAH